MAHCFDVPLVNMLCIVIGLICDNGVVDVHPTILHTYTIWYYVMP